jgi:hypothetical protein
VKTTLDLPADLVREIKLIAVNEGRKMKEVAADLLRRGLGQAPGSSESEPQKSVIDTLANGLPVVRCTPTAPVSRMSAEDILGLESKSQTQEDHQRLGHSV